ncbi:hypothetical protein [Myroides odoratimimus]|uniref:hypothetical protein n=1 Tax=Myroides odoratimimus TaxID=76832 RepID=UPI003100BE4F
MIKDTVCLVGSLLLSITCFSQEEKNNLPLKKDSISSPKQVVVYAADKFTIIRPLNIEFSNVSPYNFSPQKGITSLEEGKVEDFKQVKVSASINFIKNKNWVLGTTLGYKFTHMKTDLFDFKSVNPSMVQEDFHYHFTSLNFVYFSTLFGKRTVFSSSLIVEGSDRHFERVKGLVSGIVVLKSEAKTKMSLGLLGNIDPTSQVPILPIFTFEYRFNNGMVFDATLPKSVYIRKNVFDAGRISFGSEMDPTSFYLYNVDGTSQRYEYRQIDVNSGVIYEYAVGDFLITGKAGIKITPSARIFEKEESFNHSVVELKPDPTFYFNVGVSFNPFSLLKKK